jgi:hypothetical protein
MFVGCAAFQLPLAHQPALWASAYPSLCNGLDPTDILGQPYNCLPPAQLRLEYDVPLVPWRTFELSFFTKVLSQTGPGGPHDFKTCGVAAYVPSGRVVSRLFNMEAGDLSAWVESRGTFVAEEVGGSVVVGVWGVVGVGQIDLMFGLRCIQGFEMKLAIDTVVLRAVET